MENQNLDPKQKQSLVLKQEEWKYVINSFGTSYIFEQRANKVRKRLRKIAFFGIAVPAAVGSLVGSFSFFPQALPYLLGIAGVLSLLQLIFTIWANNSRWDEELSYSLESLADNNRLATSFEELTKTNGKEEKQIFAILRTEYKAREASDLKQGLSMEERRMGMRHALRQYKRKCYGCGKIPVSMTPTNCDTCGNF